MTAKSDRLKKQVVSKIGGPAQTRPPWQCYVTKLGLVVVLGLHDR